ncbi:MAG: hypothetical protein AAFV19_00570 [Pseudomonadota bacterium]
MRYLIVALLLTITTVLPVRAAELLMFEEEWCHWCERWNDEIGVIYHKTDEGKRAPLTRVDIHGTFPDVDLALRPQYTPTFVLIENGREIGRIEGYPGEDFFWGLLGRLLEKLPAPKQKTGT